MRFAMVLVLLIGSVRLFAADTVPAGFGESVQGLAIALAPKGDGSVVVRVRNDGVVPVNMQGAFVWLLLAESREVAFYTDKVPLDAAGLRVAPAGETEVTVRPSDLRAYSYQRGTKVVDGYPRPAEAPASARAVADILAAPVKAQAIAFLPAGGQKLTLRSKGITLSLARLASTLPADLTALVNQFRRDAFTARDAADLAAAKGPAAIPALLEALQDPGMPDFGQMWIAAALARIGGEQGAAAAAKLVDDPREGVRNVIAFHGPSMKQAQVDAAILRRAQSSNDSLFTAWAARGFSEHGRPVPAGLVVAALQSNEPRARGEVAEVLAASQEPADGLRLAKLFGDDHELVRVAAADAAARHPRQPRPVIAAMVAALDRPGESARQRIIAALGKHAGQEWQYVAGGAEDENSRLLRTVRAWWNKQKQAK